MLYCTYERKLGDEDMYQTGDRVVYCSHGICCVTAQEERTVDKKRVTYLVLEPEGQAGDRYYVPAHNAAAMAKLRYLLTAAQMDALLSSEAVRADCWTQDENRRKQRYRELINGSDPAALVQMVCTLYRHKAAQSAAGKKVHQCDENFLRDAERLLACEIAASMDLTQDAAKNRLRTCLTEK